jgi:hypothetical protein
MNITDNIKYLELSNSGRLFMLGKQKKANPLKKWGRKAEGLR